MKVSLTIASTTSPAPPSPSLRADPQTDTVLKVADSTRGWDSVPQVGPHATRRCPCATWQTKATLNLWSAAPARRSQISPILQCSVYRHTATYVHLIKDSPPMKRLILHLRPAMTADFGMGGVGVSFGLLPVRWKVRGSTLTLLLVRMGKQEVVTPRTKRNMGKASMVEEYKATRSELDSRGCCANAWGCGVNVLTPLHSP